MNLKILGDSPPETPEQDGGPDMHFFASDEAMGAIDTSPDTIDVLKNLIDTVGYRLANDDEVPLEQKVKDWVEFLKSVHLLIPDDEQDFKASLQESINNPSEWDFTERPPR